MRREAAAAKRGRGGNEVEQLGQRGRLGRDMVIAYHAIFSAYGFWLPNEQRGSWSTQVWASHLKRFGPATKTTQRRSLADRPYNRQIRAEMRNELQHAPVRFNLSQIHAIARYLNHRPAIVDAMDYVNGNPRKHDLPDQTWDFVVPLPQPSE
jgi:hypothetical protein